MIHFFMAETNVKSSFLQKITNKEAAILAAVVLSVPLYRLLYFFIKLHPIAPAFIGIFLCLSLNSLGCAIGVSVIGKSIAGASVKCSGLVLKGLIGIVICEANLIFSILSFFLLKDRALYLYEAASKGVEITHVTTAWALFFSGIISGACGMIASLGSSIVSAASMIAIAASPGTFSKLISLQLIVGGVGALGLVIGITFLKLCE